LNIKLFQMENEVYFKAVEFEKKTITDFEKWYQKEKDKIIQEILIDLKNKNILKIKTSNK